MISVKFLKCAIFFFCTKRRCSQIKAQLKVKIEDWRKAPIKPSKLKFYEMKKKNTDPKIPNSERKLIFPMFFTLHSSFKDLKSVISEF